MGAIGHLEICSDLVGSGEAVLEVVAAASMARLRHIVLEHQNFAVSAEACSGSKFIVSRAKEAYDVPTSV